jgi:hypothetical protein
MIDNSLLLYISFRLCSAFEELIYFDQFYFKKVQNYHCNHYCHNPNEQELKEYRFRL